MQFVDDVLDFTGSTLQLGKPALNDLHSGLATAPVLFAAEEHPQVQLGQLGSVIVLCITHAAALSHMCCWHIAA